MLPLSDDNRGRRSTPWVTYALIVINVVVFAYQSMLDDQALWAFLQDWAVIPREISSGTDLFTLITSAFLHGSWFHLGSNMLFLWIFGDNVEDVMGHAKFTLFYTLTAIAAALAQVFVTTDSVVPMVGASGAISGLLAAYIILFPNGRIRTLIVLGVFFSIVLLPAWIMIGYWFFLQLISGVLSLGQPDTTGGGVAFWSHIGGFLAGFALVYPLRNRDRQGYQLSRRASSSQQRSWGVGTRRR